MLKTLSLFFLSLFLLTSPIGTSSGHASADPSLLDKATVALAKNDKKSADFYMARYLGLGGTVEDLAPLLAKRALPPKAFLPGDWDEDFLRWYEDVTRLPWGKEEHWVREKARSFEITNASFAGRYYLSVVASPTLELWHLLVDGVTTRSLILCVVEPRGVQRTAIFFGRFLRNKPAQQFHMTYLQNKQRSVQHLWTPEFFDLDKDDKPEVWVRYNISWGNGFAQVLEVYRIHDDSELVLMHRFQGDNGVARRLSDGRVETGTAFDSLKSDKPFSYDKHHFETWECQKGSFAKVSEDDRPFIFKGGAWKDYFTPL